MRRCDETCDTCEDICVTGTMEEYITERCATDPEFAAAFAVAEREVAEWLTRPASAPDAE